MSDVIDKDAAAAPAVSIGQQLRAAREQAGLSLKEVASALYLTRHKLSALESDAYDKLPSAIFVQGYLRKYATLLNLDAEALVASYNQQRQAHGIHDETDWQPPTPASAPVRLPPWLGPVGIAAAVLVGVVLLANIGGDNEPLDLPEPASIASDEIDVPVSELDEVDPVVQPDELAAPAQQEAPPAVSTTETTTAPARAEPETPAPVAAQVPPAEAVSSAPGATVPAPPSAADRLAFDFLEDCWVEVADANGNVIHASLAGAGETLALSGEAPFSIMLGNAQAVSLSLNGNAVEVEARPGHRTAKLTVGD